MRFNLFSFSVMARASGFMPGTCGGPSSGEVSFSFYIASSIDCWSMVSDCFRMFEWYGDRLWCVCMHRADAGQ